MTSGCLHKLMLSKASYVALLQELQSNDCKERFIQHNKYLACLQARLSEKFKLQRKKWQTYIDDYFYHLIFNPFSADRQNS